jgi:hypothetical protein
MVVYCDVKDCDRRSEDGHCIQVNSEFGLKIHDGRCISGKTNMEYLHKQWEWHVGVELVKQRLNQSEYSKSMEAKADG